MARAGGGGDNTPSLSLADINSTFPAFEYGYTLIEMGSSKEYEVSADKIADFNASVIQGQGYIYDSVNDRYVKPNVLPDIYAAVILDGTIDLYFTSSNNFAEIAKDESFESVFGSIDGDVVYVYIYKKYAEDISSRFDDYAALILAPAGFNCSSAGGWECDKVDPDTGLRYLWLTNDNYSYAYHIYPI
ncbi:MAG: hypothetical protein LBB59_00815 [Campylobacteraceae bacterium]|jgi:hypothetical protein|nr:hypothetical protein [Campylobacteraceae bacterium]